MWRECFRQVARLAAASSFYAEFNTAEANLGSIQITPFFRMQPFTMEQNRPEDQTTATRYETVSIRRPGLKLVGDIGNIGFSALEFNGRDNESVR